MTYYTTNL